MYLDSVLHFVEYSLPRQLSVGVLSIMAHCRISSARPLTGELFLHIHFCQHFGFNLFITCQNITPVSVPKIKERLFDQFHAKLVNERTNDVDSCDTADSVKRHKC